MTMVDTLNSLLRGEIAATETYQQAIAKLNGGRGAAELEQVRNDHREAANELRKCVHDHAAQPDQGSGAWGAFAKAVEGTATLLGTSATLKALKEGEEAGAKDYQSALAKGTLPADCDSLVRSKLLPQTKAHMSLLDRLMNEVARQ